jgi:DNA-binding response OmpR family regulator
MAGKVLLVDADPATRHKLIATLLPAGYQLAVAEDPLEAPNVAILESPDIVIMGDSMTNPSGLAIVGRLFSAAETAPLPVLVIANTPEGQLAAERAGARAVIQGPATPADLLALVAAHIDNPGAIPQAPAALLGDEQRLAAVAAIRADLTGDENLDHFTKLASELLHVPVSAISLIERDRQVWASQFGIAEPWASKGESPLEYSFCQYAVTSREPLVIDNANLHPLVQNSPSIPEMNTQAYLGIPLIMSNDQAVGTLCAIDQTPRQWTEREVKILDDLADILTTQLNELSGGSGRHAAV